MRPAEPGVHGPAGPTLAVLDDPQRIAVARRLLTDMRREAVERLTRLVARLLRTEYAQLSILTDKQVVAALHGPGDRGPKEIADSMCAVTVSNGGGALVLPDAGADARVAGLPAVRSGVVGAYVGVPVAAGGALVGALCAYDARPREWRPDEVEVLRELAGVVSAELETRALAADLADDAVRLNLGFAAANVGSFDWDLVTNRLQWDDRLKELFGYTAGTFEEHFWSFEARLHPDDRERVAGAIAAAVEIGGGYEAEYRVVHPDGSVRWIAARGRVLCDEDGRPVRMLGAAHDTTAGHSASERIARHLETMGAAFLSVDREWRFTYLNAQGERLFGRSREELLGRVLWEEYPDLIGTPTHEHYTAAVATQEPTRFVQYYQPLDIWFDVRAFPAADGLSVYFDDVSARVRAERAAAASAREREEALAVAQRATGRLEILSAASARMAATLEVREVLAILTDVVLSGLGSWLAIGLREDIAAELSDRLDIPVARRLRLVEVAHADPPRRESLADALRELPPALDALDPAASAEEREISGVRATVLPLASRGRLVGVVLVGDAPDDPFDARLLHDLVMRAASAVENAVLYGAERRMGATLQRTLLPGALPRMPNIEIAARYLPGTVGRDVGGDFYVAQVLADGRLLLIIGDVMGHGMQAAAHMGQLRAILTAYAIDGDAPERVLSRLSSRITDLVDLPMATALVAVYDAPARRLTAASAGHLPPLIAADGAEPEFMDLRPGPPLGVGPTDYASRTVDVASSATVVLFTDGLIEERRRVIDDGLERLRRTVGEIRLPPEAVCDRVLADLDRTRGGEDDIALVVFRHA